MSSALVISNVALWIIVLPLTVVTAFVVRFLQETVRREMVTGLAVGASVPDVYMVPLDHSEAVPLRGFLGEPLVIVLVKPACSRCHQLMPKVKRLNARFGSEIKVLIICQGGHQEVSTFSQLTGLSGLPIYQDPEGLGMAAFCVEVTPVAMLVDRKGAILRKVISTELAEFEQRMISGIQEAIK